MIKYNLAKSILYFILRRARFSVRAVLSLAPIAFLLIFFNLTSPATFYDNSALNNKNSFLWHVAFGSSSSSIASSRPEVKEIAGLGAHAAHDDDVSSIHTAAIEARKAFNELKAPRLHVGYEKELVAADGSRFLFRVVRKEPFSDQPLPDSNFSLGLALTSGERAFDYVSGAWRYWIEIEDRGRPSNIVVQNIL